MTTYVTYETGSDTNPCVEIDLDKMLEIPKPKKVMITPSSKIKAEVADKPTGKPQYMVAVDGMEAPIMVHSTIEAAKKEAERLVKTGVTSNVRILMVVGVYKTKHEWEDWL